MRKYLYALITGERHDLFAMMVRVFLVPMSWIYRMCVWGARNSFSNGYCVGKKLSKPVISIGNLTMGGSGKTPMAIYLAKLLLSKGSRPAIIVRGYKPRIFGKRSAVADEQLMMSTLLKDVPVVANPDRYKAALETLEQNEANAIILDDGFQHWKLKRDLDIVLIDCLNPFGNGNMIPAGILREPISALRRADVIVLTKTDQVDADVIRKNIELSFPTVLVIESIHAPKSLTNIYSGESFGLRHGVCPVVAFCAIGDPVSFKSMLLTLGADVKEFVVFMDHHAYGLEDMEKIQNLCRHIGIQTVVTTCKDAVKLDEFKDFWKDYQVLSLNIEIVITKGLKEFSQRIDRVLDC